MQKECNVAETMNYSVSTEQNAEVIKSNFTKSEINAFCSERNIANMLDASFVEGKITWKIKFSLEVINKLKPGKLVKAAKRLIVGDNILSLSWSSADRKFIRLFAERLLMYSGLTRDLEDSKLLAERWEREDIEKQIRRRK